MSTTHSQPGLSSDQRSTIRSTILSTRHTLENELRRQLEKYGIYEDKRLPLENLTHLSVEEIHTRRTLDAAIERELESTEGDLERSITNYVREATKTYLNRFVALKTIEVRGFVEEILKQRPEYGNRSYIHHTVAEIAGELTDTPDDGYSTALDLAYQEIGAGIQMIFEDSEYTAIDLDSQVRNEIVEQLATISNDAWMHDETIGWVYQFFGENERGEIDDRIDKENYKVQGTDIATKTQLFTPRYIVQWMVDNSLGRLWLEMQGDRTSIDDPENCFYLAPLEDSLIDRETKDVRDIKVLDPACGSGHMLFYAFEVLYKMYLEEAKVPKKQIPNEILKNNLYGIDIDPGVTQLAALSLYLKAKTKEPEIEVEQINVMSADAVLVNGNKEEAILEGLVEPDRSVLEEIWESFENIREYGSLVRIEEKVDEILAQYENETGLDFASGQTRLFEGGMEGQGSLDATNGGDDWLSVREKIKSRISNLAEEALEQDNPVEEMFVNEVEKSVRLLDLFLYDYDVVVSNPPYLGSAKMGEDLNGFVKKNFTGSRDLYTAFIERNSEFVEDEGYVSMITMETFMYLYSFRGLRPELLDNMNFIDVGHLENRDQGYMNVCFTMRNSEQEDYVPSRFSRLVNTKGKVDGLKEITEANRRKNEHDNVYVVDQNSFKEIGRTPFVYWLGDELLSLFEKFDALDTIENVKKGLITGNNERFVRKYWEIPTQQIGDKYVLYQRSSGTDSVYYDLPQDYIEWDRDKIKTDDGVSQFPNTEYLFREGITFRGFGKYTVARIQPQNALYDGNTHFVTCEKIPQNYMLGIGCSSLFRYIMNSLNPSPKCQVGDIKRLPIKKNLERTESLQSLINTGLQSRRLLSSLQENSPDFNPEVMIDRLEDSIRDIIYSEEIIEADVQIVHGIVDRLIFEEYNISMESQEKIYNEVPQNLAEYPHIQDISSLDTSEHEFRKDVPKKHLSEDEIDQLIDDIAGSNDNDLRKISEEIKVSPYTIAAVRHKNDLYSDDKSRETAGRLLSYYIGCTMGRWDLKGLDVDKDGIIVFTENSAEPVIELVRECIELTFGTDEVDDKIQELNTLLGKDIEDWLRNRFFRHHHAEEYNRRGQCIPIYWQLESSDGAFSCFVYYHEIDANTLPKLRGQYLDPRIDELRNELETLNAQTREDNPDKELLKRKEDVQNDLDDITEFRDTIDKMIDDGVSVDVEKGIWENIKEWDQYEVLETGLPKLKSSYSR